MFSCSKVCELAGVVLLHVAHFGAPTRGVVTTWGIFSWWRSEDPEGVIKIMQCLLNCLKCKQTQNGWIVAFLHIAHGQAQHAQSRKVFLPLRSVTAEWLSVEWSSKAMDRILGRQWWWWQFLISLNSPNNSPHENRPRMAN